VLQGHDHTYARGTIGEAPAAAGPQRPESRAAGTGPVVTTMFVNSVSGPKMYKFKADRWDQYAPSGVRLDRFAEGAQFFQVIEIKGDALDYRAYAATGDLYDSFILRKDGAGTSPTTDFLANQSLQRLQGLERFSPDWAEKSRSNTLK
jgi:hypothetical protein